MPSKYYFIVYVLRVGGLPELSYNDVINIHPLVWQINKEKERKEKLDFTMASGRPAPPIVVLVDWREITQAEYSILKYTPTETSQPQG